MSNCKIIIPISNTDLAFHVIQVLQVVNFFLKAVNLSSCLVPSGANPVQLLTQAAVLRLCCLQHKTTSAGQALCSLQGWL